MTDLSQKIIEKIKTEHIEPEARWKFLARRFLLWTGIVIAALLGALSLGLIIFTFFELDEEILSFAPGRLFSPALLRSIPLLWIAAAIAFVWMAIAEFRNTRHGYRYHTATIIGIIIFAVVTGAIVVHFSGINRLADQSLHGAIPGYGRFVENSEHFWSQPENGFLAGEIGTVNNSGFLLRDLSGKTWAIAVTSETVIRPRVRVERSARVKVVGDETGEDSFMAEDIRPWDRDSYHSFPPIPRDIQDDHDQDNGR